MQLAASTRNEAPTKHQASRGVVARDACVHLFVCLSSWLIPQGSRGCAGWCCQQSHHEKRALADTSLHRLCFKLTLLPLTQLRHATCQRVVHDDQRKAHPSLPSDTYFASCVLITDMYEGSFMWRVPWCVPQGQHRLSCPHPLVLLNPGQHPAVDGQRCWAVALQHQQAGQPMQRCHHRTLQRSQQRMACLTHANEREWNRLFRWKTSVSSVSEQCKCSWLIAAERIFPSQAVAQSEWGSTTTNSQLVPPPAWVEEPLQTWTDTKPSWS